MNDYEDFFKDVGEDVAAINTKSGKPEFAKTITFTCEHCAGSGLWKGGRTNYRGNNKCIPCRGTGSFKTSASDRAKARSAKINREGKRLSDKLAAFNTDNPGVAEFLHNASTWSDFAGSLSAALRKWGSLTERQLASVRSMMTKVEANKAARAEADGARAVDLSPVREMFDRAFANGLKRPTYRAEGLVISRAPDNGRNAGALYVKARGEYEGKVVDGIFSGRDEGVLDALHAISKDPKAAAVKYGRETGECCCCGRELTDPNSIEAGIGPVCATKWF